MASGWDIHWDAEIFQKSGNHLNTLRTGDADLRLYITTVQDG
jgi:hypothetical protein